MTSTLGFLLCVLAVVSPLATALQNCDRHADCLEGHYCHFSYGADHSRGTGLCFARNTAEEQEGLETVLLEQEATPALKKFDPTGLKVSSLTVQAPEGKTAKVVLGSGEAGLFSIGVAPGGVFTIAQGEESKEVLKVDSDGNVVARTKVLAAGALKADIGFIVNNVAQWALTSSEDFSVSTNGWKTDKGADVATSKCSTGHVLAGLYTNEVITKTYKDLPKHTRVRVQATFHFIDAWAGETGYMQLSSGDKGAMEYAWTETYDMADYTGLIDVCGGEKGEGKFASTIDVTIYHTGDTLDVSFGTTLAETAGRASFGVSSVDISTRAVDM